ncbi:MAG: hypothetical protein JJ900_02445 [Rhodospirillales bacterium]|nr:hypothetical protein [Rhodospirillales bacterium]MBO6785683.1 hypothetical protein [Rhodospirillales bacterium]
MSSTGSTDTTIWIGRCAVADGDVRLETPGGMEKPLIQDARLRAGDKVATGEAATAALSFSDGTRLVLSAHSVLSIDQYFYEDDQEDDSAVFTFEAGTCVIEAGDLSINADAFIVFAGAATLGLRCARAALRVDPLGYDLVTLMPAASGPLGEILVHNKIGMQMLDSPWQSLRLGAEDTDIPAPLTLPSNVVGETYGGPGVWSLLQSPLEGGDDLVEQFQPFRALQDRFLERQFVRSNVFPGGGAAKTGDGDAMLEDAFEGTRFRLENPEPETST